MKTLVVKCLLSWVLFTGVGVVIVRSFHDPEPIVAIGISFVMGLMGLFFGFLWGILTDKEI